ncbi:hypothetical protein O6H91_07G026300 [Diphasiastrum complanatum]|uniref:Uncharacterized protein n=1 Tax=Diphasiastrum complanatum TaxID=34168 RepID=A0ACC2D3E9_DIPCM|nr:hypothetical protein O6H91_07G026300 [Diphasiastrum complanatum]
MAASRSSSAGKLTTTQRHQMELERKVGDMLGTFVGLGRHQRSVLLELWREEHVEFLVQKGLRRLGASYSVLDSSRPWLCYWSLHSLALLGESFNLELGDDVIEFLERCQMPHLATTYAAVCALVTLGGAKALGSINREKMLQFLTRMKDSSGGFRLHEGGEMDVRGCYTAIAVAHILGILTPTITYKVNEFVVSCQTYEGGIGGEPGAEAHGGYTFCGLAALILTNQMEGLDLPSLLKWAAKRQGKVEGGFQGRTNKLVDGCYSFWQGGIFPLIQHVIPRLVSQLPVFRNHLLHPADENDVLHMCCKVKTCLESKKTGFVHDNSINSCISGEEDEGTSEPNIQITRTRIEGKESPPIMSAETLFPLKFHGSYQNITDAQQHSTDCFSKEDEQTKHGAAQGLSTFNQDSCFVRPFFNTQALQAYVLICCQVLEGGLIDKPGKPRDFYHTCYCLSGLSTAQHPTWLQAEACPSESDVLGPSCNLLEPTHPLCNVHFERYLEARSFFNDLSL